MKRLIIILSLCSLLINFSGCKKEDEEDSEVIETTTTVLTEVTATLSADEISKSIEDNINYNEKYFKELIETLKDYFNFDEYYTKDEQDSLSYAYSLSFCENTKSYTHKIASITVMQIQSTEITCTIDTNQGTYVGVFSITELGFRSLRKE